MHAFLWDMSQRPMHMPWINLHHHFFFFFLICLGLRSGLGSVQVLGHLQGQVGGGGSAKRHQLPCTSIHAFEI